MGVCIKAKVADEQPTIPGVKVPTMLGPREAPGRANGSTGLVASRRFLEPCVRFSRTYILPGAGETVVRGRLWPPGRAFDAALSPSMKQIKMSLTPHCLRSVRTDVLGAVCGC